MEDEPVLNEDELSPLENRLGVVLDDTAFAPPCWGTMPEGMELTLARYVEKEPDHNIAGVYTGTARGRTIHVAVADFNIPHLETDGSLAADVYSIGRDDLKARGLDQDVRLMCEFEDGGERGWPGLPGTYQNMAAVCDKARDFPWWVRHAVEKIAFNLAAARLAELTRRFGETV